jgi:hypothetical protein
MRQGWLSSCPRNLGFDTPVRRVVNHVQQYEDFRCISSCYTALAAHFRKFYYTSFHVAVPLHSLPAAFLSITKDSGTILGQHHQILAAEENT